MNVVPVIPSCGNWSRNGAVCSQEGTLVCANCKLVSYCGRDCQKKHWTEHKKACKSALAKSSWRPAWDIQHREPAWAFGAAATNLHNPFGSDKHLWGNTPAVNILHLERNEGSAYGEDIAVLFAASGDLRNVIKTIQELPNTFSHRIEVTINDRDFDVTARNVILLLFSCASHGNGNPGAPDHTAMLETAEIMIHLWYSAFLPISLLSKLQSIVKPLIVEVCAKIAAKPPDTVLGKTWQFLHNTTIRVVLRKEDWLKLERYLDNPTGLEFDTACKIRSAIVLAQERADYRDRWYYKDATPFMRIAKRRFREDGLLLPFGHPRTGFNTPNPTFFQGPGFWPFDDKADPLSGWRIDEVNQTPSHAAEDLYGRLFIYLREVFDKFLRRLVTGNLHFELHNVDARELSKHLDAKKYARIEVSNICDFCWVGTRETLVRLSSLLQTQQQNPHATLIAVYLNAVGEMVKRSSQEDQVPNMKLLSKYLPFKPTFPLPSPEGAELYKIWDARSLVTDGDKFFNRYMANLDLRQISADSGLVMKKTNTIVDKWPTQLKLKPGDPGARKEFDLLLASSFTGYERYVEWKRRD
ncbi:hypothetical protein HD806DRAFT_522187 [Xylariaceae sp. AK1471]|nr:hypothetical protein HD806DRAFT_522187 [Xylariaceae sp. AK1471]